MREILLELENIWKAFPGVQALSSIELTVEKGEIHALVGENGAGKSTLIKILGGVHRADQGRIKMNGEELAFSNPRDALKKGISIIYQEFNLIPTLSVAENIYLGKELHGRLGGLKRRDMCTHARQLLEQLGMGELNPGELVKNLSVARQQLVEIAKALSNETALLIMDEPTAVLTNRETEKLFQIMKSLKQKGMSILFVSHRLEEVQLLCDRITILRDGKNMVALDNKDHHVSKDVIVQHMVGRKLRDYYPRRKKSPGEKKVLEVQGLTKAGMFEDISFSLKEGEILGVAGLVGAGRTEVAKTIFGVWERDAGTIRLEGRELHLKNIREAIRAGITLVPENRKEEGLVLLMHMADNIGLPNASLIASGGVVEKKKLRKLAEDSIGLLDIRPPYPERNIGEFSGGNQQKAVIAKWLATSPKVLILDEPTRGVDVGAKTEIYMLMRRLTEQGVSILFISSEMPELLGMCDRILVMHEGRLTGEFHQEQMNQEEIMRAASGL
ncbi:MAG: sugar ABC transporter ATP-binding protein [Lachnospiraceae bacterium]|nr:sugar ABC transporter ATP-binding protein [Lachnospiraceae bacterium]